LRGLRRRRFQARQRRLERPEKSLFLPDDRLRRVEPLFQGEARLSIRQAHEAPAAQQFDQVELDVIEINHADNLAIELAQVNHERIQSRCVAAVDSKSFFSIVAESKAQAALAGRAKTNKNEALGRGRLCGDAGSNQRV
jgi:hypothetical protein